MFHALKAFERLDGGGRSSCIGGSTEMCLRGLPLGEDVVGESSVSPPSALSELEYPFKSNHSKSLIHRFAEGRYATRDLSLYHVYCTHATQVVRWRFRISDTSAGWYILNCNTCPWTTIRRTHLRLMRDRKVGWVNHAHRVPPQWDEGHGLRREN